MPFFLVGKLTHYIDVSTSCSYSLSQIVTIQLSYQKTEMDRKCNHIHSTKTINSTKRPKIFQIKKLEEIVEFGKIYNHLDPLMTECLSK
jgi:hypothetical protein